MSERGPKGDHGQHGDTGDRGREGVSGPLGDRGDTGLKGERGERGPTGDHGQHGDTGRAGPQGETGSVGKVPTYIAVALLILTLILVVVTLFQVFRIEGFTHDLRDSGVASCERQNETRTILSDFIVADQKGSQKLPPEFFPSIPPAEFERLQRKGAEAAAAIAAKLKPLDCEVVVPEP